MMKADLQMVFAFVQDSFNPITSKEKCMEICSIKDIISYKHKHFQEVLKYIIK